MASRYKYKTKDCMQLMKHMSTVASLIKKDCLMSPTTSHNSQEVRVWARPSCAVAAATWVLAFYDSLLFWEEKEEKTFVEILGTSHKYFLARLFQHFSLDVRIDAITQIYDCDLPTSKYLVVTEKEVLYFGQPRSSRLAKGSLLSASLSKEKVVVRDLDMTFSSNESLRQRKRYRGTKDLSLN